MQEEQKLKSDQDYISKAQKNLKSEDAIRELSEQETKLMEEFQQNDKEIDELLDQVIDLAKGLGEHARNLNTGIMTQQRLIKNINKRAEKARADLSRKNDALASTLKKYRSTNKLCVDVILIVVFLALVGVLIHVIKSKF